MIKLYGIKNCDVMQKAFKWLDAHKVPYTFHDYRVDGLDAATVSEWLRHLPLAKLLNTKSTSYRGFTDEQKAAAADEAGAIQLMVEHTSVIKRPVWAFADGRYALGWNEQEIAAMVTNGNG